MNNHFEIRIAKITDSKGIAAIYEPYVLHTAITFEYEVPTAAEFSERIQTITNEYPWLVCLQNNQIVGYAYAHKHRNRTAYNWSTESTIYIAEGAHRKGIARILYDTLFAILKLQGYVNVYAGVLVPNEKSEGLHAAMGFKEIGNFTKIGYKLGKWHDVKWFELHLIEHPDTPTPLKTLQEIEDTELQTILDKANERINQIP